MADMIFKRTIYNEMLEWKKCNGSYALLVKGARRIGKTTIVKEFAREEYRSAIIIDFSIANNDYKKKPFLHRVGKKCSYNA